MPTLQKREIKMLVSKNHSALNTNTLNDASKEGSKANDE